MTLAVLDVHYQHTGARAACVVAASWEATTPEFVRTAHLPAVAPYAPGAFYQRELPCLLAVLELLPTRPDAVVVDGYVWLPDGRPGLGAHLHAALARRIPVVGIAKTPYAGVDSSSEILAVRRGRSQKPLYVSAAGMTPQAAADLVRHMAGAHRIPTLVRLADALARTGELPGPQPAS